MPPDTDQLQFIRAIRGAPATILLLLLLRGSSMTNLEICHWTGFTDKPVTAALAVLEHLGVLQYNGRQHGWSLRSGVQSLLPFIHQLGEPVDKEIGNSPMIGNSPIYLTTTAATNGRENSSLERSSSSSRLDRKYSDLVMSTHPNGHASCNGNACNDPRVADWLQRAGVGEKSRKYRELLAADLDWRTVRAHALERLAQPDDLSVGLFITRLLDGDPPPAVDRCPECYRPLNDYGQCTGYALRLCDYAGEEDEEE